MKKRILFVEDNELLLRMYALMLDDAPEQWEVATAGSGAEALALMDHANFDVLVSDLNMPGMNGIELIGKVMERSPHSSRIIISGQNDQEYVANCLGVTHQFLPKPFDVKVLRSTLQRISALDVYLKNERLKTLVGQMSGLPTFPSCYQELMSELRSEEPSLSRIAEIIARDPGLTAKVFQVVNSAALGLTRRITSPMEAVQFLGLSTVCSLALSAHVFLVYTGQVRQRLQVEELWNHSMGTAMLARKIMQIEKADPSEAEDAYIGGMLHDIGKLMLATGLPELCQKAWAISTDRHIPLHEAELETIGATHAEVAAYLLGLWGLPASIVEAVAFHHTPQAGALETFGPLAAVHVANDLEHAARQGSFGVSESSVDTDYLAAIGVQDRIGKWRKEAAQMFPIPSARSA